MSAINQSLCLMIHCSKRIRWRVCVGLGFPFSGAATFRLGTLLRSLSSGCWAASTCTRIFNPIAGQFASIWHETCRARVSFCCFHFYFIFFLAVVVCYWNQGLPYPFRTVCRSMPPFRAGHVKHFLFNFLKGKWWLYRDNQRCPSFQFVWFIAVVWFFFVFRLFVVVFFC